MTERQRIKNFASVARTLDLARRRNICAWTKIFRAGQAKNALDELNASGAITHHQYRVLDAWIFNGREADMARLRPVKLSRKWWKAKPKKAEPKPKLVKRKSVKKKRPSQKMRRHAFRKKQRRAA